MMSLAAGNLRLNLARYLGTVNQVQRVALSNLSDEQNLDLASKDFNIESTRSKEVESREPRVNG